MLFCLTVLVGNDARAGWRAHALVVEGWGGALGKAQDQAFFRPFAASTGTGILRYVWDGGSLPAPAGRHAWALALVEDSTARIACMQGRLQRLGGSPGSADACGVPALHDGIALAWDRGRIPAAPHWSDFWNIVRYPGKRGLRKDPRSTLEIALMADGVAASDVYTVLATPEGVDRAFHKLSQLRPYIVWWTSAAESARIIGDGSVLMTSAAGGEVAASAGSGHRDVGLQWAQSLDDGLSWGVAPGLDSTVRDRARALLHYMSQPEQIARFAGLYHARPDDPSLQPMPMDAAFWQTHLPGLAKRFADWLATP
ncbi:extracellular solute-binding protein [Gluconacetobacter diazotrophicus]|uniref:Extracellular solute-binding protein n=1 Tax=Gluconacetobacter diazotrophicus TaxID=33996 RepID=A0A7W4NN49_GLUDI|nr:extracellular solute-binding protein [Gluconacetobacter diazotrophicus]MBB2158248.1 extracellular solute-binding protein [Gluconacetobacter diazotrophicus]